MREVSFLGAHVPVEWIAAHGMRPRRLALHARHADAGQPGVCPYAQALMGETCEGGGDLVVVAAACDQIRRAAARLREEFQEQPLFLIDVPATRGTAAAELYRQECRRLSRFLVRFGGIRPRPDGRFEPIADARPLQPMHGVPLAVVGGPLLSEHRELFAVIAGLGGQVVLDATEGGERTLPAASADIRSMPLLDAVAAARFESIPDVFQRPNDALASWLAQRVKQREVRGLVCCSYTWCDLWRAGQRHLADVAQVPALFLELGAETKLTGRTVTRIEAFLESLRA